MDEVIRNLSRSWRLSHDAFRLTRLTLAGWAGVTLCIGVTGFSAAVMAQNFPSRNITIIIPTSAGAGLDSLGRVIGQRLAAGFGRTVVVDNRPGANSLIGAELVARSVPDGHFLLFANSIIIQSQVVPPKPAFNIERDLAPVTLTDRIPFVLAVHPSLPVRNVKELVSLAKAKPGALSYSTGGSLTMELLKLNANLDIHGIRYKGAAPSTIALLSGEVQISMLTTSNVQPHIRSGKARGIAVTSLKRSAALPALPTLHEAGVKDFEVNEWHGFFVAPKTPPTIIALLHAEVNKTLTTPEVKERFASDGAETAGTTPSELASFVSSEIRKWADVVQRSDMKF